MVAKLVLNEMGNYEYVNDVTTTKKPIIPSVDEFEAYEGTQKKSELVSAPSIGEQTQKVMRETPGQFKTTFDEKTGQFTTKETAPSAGRMVDYTPGEITAESTEPTALQKVMTMADQNRPEPIDYSQIISDAYKATQPTFKDQLVSTAIDVGGNILTNYVTKKMTGAAGDIIINNMTQRVLGKTLSGSLASAQSGSMMTGASMVNPYTMAAAALMTKPGRKVAKKVVKTVLKPVKKVTDAVKKIFSDIRLKTNIEFIGKSPSNINIYEFNYIGSPIKYIGVMAHEVPWASEKHESGYLMVDYNKVDVKFRRLN